MKSHTLMQAIARANRVFPGKSCGIIVDYVNVFKYMQEALSDYASTDGDDGNYPAKNIEQLIINIDNCILECEAFLLPLGINLDEIIAFVAEFSHDPAILIGGNGQENIIKIQDRLKQICDSLNSKENKLMFE
jgi:type I site-specific restriction-modification system R (restriction) subunit